MAEACISRPLQRTDAPGPVGPLHGEHGNVPAQQAPSMPFGFGNYGAKACSRRGVSRQPAEVRPGVEKVAVREHRVGLAQLRVDESHYLQGAVETR